MHIDRTQNPPQALGAALLRIGPGMILAASIVGSGELIATTKTGAAAGFYLLWLIVVGCIIKVFAQVEFGRYAIVTGRTAMQGINEVPGPRLVVSWMLWYWLAMFVASLGQLGGIVGGVGQAMAISVPLTEDGQRYNQITDAKIEKSVLEQTTRQAGVDPTRVAEAHARIAELEGILSQLGPEPVARDAQFWAGIMTVITAVLLVVGRYGLIQSVSTVLVAGFTVMTVVNVILLQTYAEWSIGWQDLIDGMSFRLPPGDALKALSVALATFGIIGVGSNELLAYPYWCLEKGYARFVGPRDGTRAWGERARGWLRVMRLDAWGSMIVYTFATLAFYLSGAAILGRTGLDPGGSDMIRTLRAMYDPVFGDSAEWLFLFGAFAVLYSTFFVATASQARVAADALGLWTLAKNDEAARFRLTKIFSGLFPFLCLGMFLFFKEPTTLVLVSGLMQTLMLPMLAFATLYFRYRRCDPEVAPGKVWDLLLWASSFGLLLVGLAAVADKLGILGRLFGVPLE